MSSSVAHHAARKSLSYHFETTFVKNPMFTDFSQCVFPGVAVNIIFGILREISCLGGRASVFSRATERQLPKLMAERTPFIF